MTSRLVRASFTDHDITVYQAFPSQIADAAIAAGTFVEPFKRGRMTWIKPSFLWMMHRSGWAAKPGQERVLAIQITRDGFEWALAHAALSHYEPGTYDSQRQWAERLRASPVRIQWDPDRSLRLAPLPHRAIQVGLSGEAVSRYLDQWITSITDITPLAERIHHHVSTNDLDSASAELPAERVYPLPTPVGMRIGASLELPPRSQGSARRSSWPSADTTSACFWCQSADASRTSTSRHNRQGHDYSAVPRRHLAPSPNPLHPLDTRGISGHASEASADASRTPMPSNAPVVPGRRGNFTSAVVP